MTTPDLDFDPAGDALVADGRFTIHRVSDGKVYMARGNSTEDHELLRAATPSDTNWFSGWMAFGADSLAEVVRWMEASK